jgi:hypothetical protein
LDFFSGYNASIINNANQYWKTTMTTSNANQSSATPDSYDSHMIPAETAARKDREGADFKQVPTDAEGAKSLDTTGGETTDTEGLANNYAVEPEMYSETPGDMATPGKYTIVDIFSSPAAAENAVAKMTESGLDTPKISILDSTNADGLAAALVESGIADDQALNYEVELRAGKWLVRVVGSEADILQANQVLHAIGHRTLAEVSA